MRPEQIREINKLIEEVLGPQCLDITDFEEKDRRIAELEGQLAEAQEELAAAILSTDHLATEMVYHGNSVSWWYSKATAYKSALGKCWDALNIAGIHADGETDVATAIGKLSEEIARMRPVVSSIEILESAVGIAIYWLNHGQPNTALTALKNKRKEYEQSTTTDKEGE